MVALTKIKVALPPFNQLRAQGPSTLAVSQDKPADCRAMAQSSETAPSTDLLTELQSWEVFQADLPPCPKAKHLALRHSSAAHPWLTILSWATLSTTHTPPAFVRICL